MQLEIDYDKARQPAPLFDGDYGNGQTTLTKYLELDTWTPMQAAMLVCGIQPPDGSSNFPQGSMSLGNSFIMETDDPFREAKRVYQIWASQVNPPDRVRPAEFVAWCQARNINTDWLRDVVGRPDCNASLPDGQSPFIVPLQPAVVPPEYLALPPDAMVSWECGQLGIASRLSKASTLVDCVEGIIARQKTGRYRLAEAALILSNETGDEAASIAAKLELAAQGGKLDIYCSDESFKMDCVPAASAHRFVHDAYAEDLNSYLDLMSPRTIYRFPVPAPVEGNAGICYDETEPEAKARGKNKTAKTVELERRVQELMTTHWNARTDGKRTKAALYQKVYDDLVREGKKGARDLTLSMVIDAAKPWRKPVIVRSGLSGRGGMPELTGRQRFKGDRS